MAELDFGFGKLIAEIEQVSGHSVKTVNNEMHRIMVEVQKEAVENAPVDKGNLERSIKVQNLGQRRAWAVYVDEAEPDDTGRYTVGDYAPFLHEGVYDLGPLSTAKQATNGHIVGRKFLERAFDTTTQGGSAVAQLNEALNAALAERYRI